MTRPIGKSLHRRKVDDDDDIQDYKRPWVGLSEQDINELKFNLPDMYYWVDVVRATEKKIKGEERMTQDEMIELAIQGHASTRDAIRWAINQERERMTVVAMNAAEKAVDVAIKLEREACAKLLETTDLGGLKDNPAMQSWVAEMLLAYVKAIRARGQA